MNSYKDRVKATGEVSDVGGTQSMPCRGCGAMTAWETLSKLGARCERCYGQYCSRPQLAPEWASKVPSKDNPKAWAEALRQRELAGGRLSKVQREAWRAALGHKL